MAARNKQPKKNEGALARPPKVSTASSGVEFDEVVALSDTARSRAVAAVNHELVDLYWRVGEYISRKIETAAWGDGVVAQLAAHIANTHPNLQGFTRANLFRMRQFFETYRGDENVAPLVRQLPWTHNLLILGRSKRAEERAFYLRMTIQERWGKRELERQLDGALFERVVLSPPQVSPSLVRMGGNAAAAFKDAYLVEFLELPASHTEADLQRGLVANLRLFLLELGGDFTFVGEQYRLQVGGRDFFLDLLFYHRSLCCLVAFELKVDQFEPADLGQLQFYLEALDRDVRKPHEQPSIGVLLCATKDDEVVEYALSRTVSPALVSEYQTQLPNKALLQAKLHEFYERAKSEVVTPEPVKKTGKRKKT